MNGFTINSGFKVNGDIAKRDAASSSSGSRVKGFRDKGEWGYD